jgi:hypothetical protein
MSCLSTGTEYLLFATCHGTNRTALHADFAVQSACHIEIEGGLV